MDRVITCVKLYGGSTTGLTVITWAAGIASAQGWDVVEAETERPSSAIFPAPVWTARKAVSP